MAYKNKEDYKKWYEKNRDRQLKKQKEYYQKNKDNWKTEYIKKKSKEWAKNNPDKKRQTSKKMRLKYPQKMRVRLLAWRNILLNKNCGICESIEKLERHHWRYDKPLLVNTLCKQCHVIQHERRKICV